MKKTAAVSDEQIISALVTHGTVKEAAAAVGLAPRPIYDRMKGADFQALYRAARADIVRQAVHDLTGSLAAAIRTVADIMTDQKNNPAVRLQAAQTIINNAAKFSQYITKDETETQAQADSARFFP